MSLTKSALQGLFAQARIVFEGANVEVRHNSRKYTGTRLPYEKGEVVDEVGAMFTIQGGVRLLTSEFIGSWPKAGDTIDVKPPDSNNWLTYVVVSTRLDEMEATMLLTYGERYDQDGML